MFREKGVRFIAIANSIDSKNQESGEFAPFLNIMSEWYLRDASRKVKSVMKSKGTSGERLTFTPIYGYMIDPNDKGKWIIDTEAAEVVRRIFRLTIEGKGPYEIARILANDKVERPTYYLATREIVKYKRHDMSDPYRWSGNTIVKMIAKPEYIGHTVNFRTCKDSYKDKRAKENAKEDWIIFENTHPAIVDNETWETAQKCRKTVRRYDTVGEANPLTGLVYCADCGAKMYNHRTANPLHYVNEKGYNCTRKPKDIYTCSTYNTTGRKFNQKCTQHHIRTVILKELVLASIKTVSGYVKSNEAEFIKQIRETSTVQQKQTAKNHKARIVKEQKRVNEINNLIRKIYEDNANGKLTDKRFDLLSSEYENEQEQLEQSICTLQTELDNFNTDSVRADKFIEIVKKYTDFSELTAPMINEFIEKIVVHEGDYSSGERIQNVDIYLNFIGKFDMPAPELTQQEIMAAEKARRRREQCREAQRRYAERQKNISQAFNFGPTWPEVTAQ